MMDHPTDSLTNPDRQPSATTRAKSARAALKKYGLSDSEGIGATVLADMARVQQEISLEADFIKSRDLVTAARDAVSKAEKIGEAKPLTPENAPAILEAIVAACDSLTSVLPTATTPAYLAAVLTSPKTSRGLIDALHELLSLRMALVRWIHMESVAIETARDAETDSVESARSLIKETTGQMRNGLIIGRRLKTDLFELSQRLHTRTWSQLDSRKRTEGSERRTPEDGRPLDVANRRALTILEASGCKSPAVALAALLFVRETKGDYETVKKNCYRAWDRLREDRQGALEK